MTNKRLFKDNKRQKLEIARKEKVINHIKADQISLKKELFITKEENNKNKSKMDEICKENALLNDKLEKLKQHQINTRDLENDKIALLFKNSFFKNKNGILSKSLEIALKEKAEITKALTEEKMLLENMKKEFEEQKMKENDTINSLKQEIVYKIDKIKALDIQNEKNRDELIEKDVLIKQLETKYKEEKDVTKKSEEVLKLLKNDYNTLIVEKNVIAKESEDKTTTINTLEEKTLKNNKRIVDLEKKCIYLFNKSTFVCNRLEKKKSKLFRCFC